MSNSQVLLRVRSAEAVTGSVGLLVFRPARLLSSFRAHAAGLAFELDDETEVRVHVTSSTRPASLLPQTEVRLHREGMIGVRFHGSASSAKFGVHFLGEDGPLRWREAPSDQLTWFDPPAGATGVAFSVLAGGRGKVRLEAIDVITPPHQSILSLGDELAAQLSRTVFPTARISWPTAIPVQVRDSGEITVSGRGLSATQPDWPDATSEDRTDQLLIHGFAFADDLLETVGGDAALARLLIDWSKAHPPRAHSTTVMAWNDMAVSRRTMAILRALDGLRFTAEPGVVRSLTEMLVDHAEWLAHPRNYIADHDHGLYADTALESAARALQFHPLSDRWLRLARERLQSTAETIVDPVEGTVREHSPSYVSAVADLIEERRRNDLSDNLGDGIADEFGRTLSALTTPDGHLIPWGDTSLDHTSPIDRPVGVFGFPRTGWAASHHPDSMTALTSSFHSRNHKHADELSMVFYDRGGPVIFEAALPGYGYGTEERSFAEAPEAHSGVLIELDGIAPPSSEPFGSGIVEPARSDLWHVLMGWNPGLTGARHSRWIFHHADLIAVVDLVAGEDVRTVTRLLHVAPDRSVEQDEGRVRIGTWTLTPDVGRPCESRVSPSHHFPTPGTVASHRVVELRDQGPGLRAFSLRRAAASAEIVDVKASGTRGRLDVELQLNDGSAVRAEASPATSPRHLHLVVTETAV